MVKNVKSTTVVVGRFKVNPGCALPSVALSESERVSLERFLKLGILKEEAEAPKVEAKTKAKAEEKVEAKVEAKTEEKVEEKVEAKTEEKAEEKAEAKVEAAPKAAKGKASRQ